VDYFNFLTEGEKEEFALFLKRVTFDDALNKTTGGDDKKEAYWILEIINKVQTQLKESGYAPR